MMKQNINNPSYNPSNLYNLQMKNQYSASGASQQNNQNNNDTIYGSTLSSTPLQVKTKVNLDYGNINGSSMINNKSQLNSPTKHSRKFSHSNRPDQDDDELDNMVDAILNDDELTLNQVIYNVILIFCVIQTIKQSKGSMIVQQNDNKIKVLDTSGTQFKKYSAVALNYEPFNQTTIKDGMIANLTSKIGSQMSRFVEEKKQQNYQNTSRQNIPVEHLDLQSRPQLIQENNDVESDDDFDFLLRQSMERGKLKHNSLQKQVIPPQTNGNQKGIRQSLDFNVDDLLDELRNDQSVEIDNKKLSVNYQTVNRQPTLVKQTSRIQSCPSGIPSKQSTMNRFESDIIDQFSNSDLDIYLDKIKRKYCDEKPKTLEQMNKIYRQRDGVRVYELYIEQQSKQQLKCWVKGLPNDGRSLVKASYEQKSGIFCGFEKLSFSSGDQIKIVSASVENTYLLFGFKVSANQLKHQQDIAEVFAIESTNVRPLFDQYPLGYRSYLLKDWNEIGVHNHNQFLTSSSALPLGNVPIVNELYLAVKDFNPEDTEPLITQEGIKLLNFRSGEILQMTLQTNQGGWFEGYRTNDPDCLCGLTHISAVKKINFQ
eukprot:403348324